MELLIGTLSVVFLALVSRLWVIQRRRRLDLLRRVYRLGAEIDLPISPSVQGYTVTQLANFLGMLERIKLDRRRRRQAAADQTPSYWITQQDRI